MEYLNPIIILADLERLIRGEEPHVPLPVLAAHVHRYFAVAFALGHQVEPTPGDDSALSLEMLYDLEDPRP